MTVKLEHRAVAAEVGPDVESQQHCRKKTEPHVPVLSQREEPPNDDNNENDDEPSRKKKARHISFGDVVFHEFPPTIGDNPSVSSGCPIMLSYRHERTSSMTLEAYEDDRKRWANGLGLSNPRRSGRMLILDKRDREER